MRSCTRCFAKFTSWIRNEAATRTTGRFPPRVSVQRGPGSLRALIAQLSQKLLPDLIQIEFTHFAGFRDCAPGIPALLVEHDLTFSLYRQLAEANPTPASWKEYERWLAFERKWLAAYEGVWTVSEADRHSRDRRRKARGRLARSA